MEQIPFVSVIVPMYNAEKYMEELLNSLLAQTLKNFEVIIVDDCSTDKSCEIVESYKPKFEGRLKLMKLKINSGAGEARNFGLELSRGKYIFFMDSDDIITKTALLELFNIAEKFQADVIYCEKYFMSEGIGKIFMENIHVADSKIQFGEFVNKPTPITENLQIRIQEWLNNRFWMTPWLRLSSRDFLINNNIKFQTLHHQNDYGWAFMELCLAKNFVRVPNLCYIRRMRGDSLSGLKKNVDTFLYRWLEKTVCGMKDIDNFMSKIDFFKKHPEYRYAVLSKWGSDDLKRAFRDSVKTPPHIIREILMDKFKNFFGEHETLLSYLLTNNIMLIRNLVIANQKIMELSASQVSEEV